MARLPGRTHAHVAAIIALLVASPALAEHEHHAHEADSAQVTASIGVIAASYRSRLFDGNYQGGSVGVGYARGRFEVGVRGLAYRIDRNGKTYRGFGDTMLHGAARLYDRGAFSAGAHLMVMAPTGAEMTGLGMGHWMVMGGGWASYAVPVVALSGSLGYARGIGGEDAHAEHGGGGGWPLVDPMSFAEVTFDASAMVPVAESIAVGARVLGALPTDDDARVIGGARVSWRTGRLETFAEAQAGLAGDPVRVRGLVSTSMTF